SDAPESAPSTIRAIRPIGAVRLGVEGSLSMTSSKRARNEKMPVAAVVAMNVRGELRKLIQMSRAAQQASASAGRERHHETTPIKNDKRSTNAGGIALTSQQNKTASGFCGRDMGKSTAPRPIAIAL